jgi:hypothetical protein
VWGGGFKKIEGGGGRGSKPLKWKSREKEVQRERTEKERGEGVREKRERHKRDMEKKI